ncbi:hypothetical protein OH76DRAFT_1423904 [Lentinus brumalis]|uniref:Uncharacterized protein n=1 Tax=Lentinus brumalis TaxID=2498619 RepID=A0A371CIL4_9APHY|nr:hypothetical protein OH76DRAFT_1423904 [Polyporus brumalis]
MADVDKSSTSHPDPSTTPSSTPTTEYGPIASDLGEINLGGRKPPARPGLTVLSLCLSHETWRDTLALPVLGAAYLVHLRYRRSAPRRIPALTSLRLAELYGTAGFTWIIMREEERLKQRTFRDRDLLMIEALDYPSDDAIGARLYWWYNHIWSDPVEWNLAFTNLVAEYVQLALELSRHDRDVCLTHIANTMHEPGDNEAYIYGAKPFAMALCGVTPLAMLARWIGRRALWLPLNAVQRALVYATVGTAAAQSYQHASYTTCTSRFQRPGHAWEMKRMSIISFVSVGA